MEDKPEDVKVGVDTRSTVLTRLGSPSESATFDPNIWFYISQVTDKIAYKNPSRAHTHRGGDRLRQG